MDMFKLDRNSPVPLYYQLYNFFLERIKDGTYKSGDMLPTEADIMGRYGVSRATARQAFGELVHHGYVIREKSKGTFVNDIDASLNYRDKVTGFSAISRLHGRVELTSKVLESSIVEAPPFVCEPLGIKLGDKVFYLKRVRSIKGLPTVYTEDWVICTECIGIETVDFMDKSLHSILEERYKIIPHHAARTFECCHATTEEQLRELNVRKSQPLLKFTSMIYDIRGNPIEFCNAVINGKYTIYEG